MTRGFERVGIIYDVATQAVQRFVTKKIFIMVRGGGEGGNFSDKTSAANV